MRLQTPVSLCLAFLLVVGCSSGTKGPQVAPADGRITLQGKPIAGAQVMFVPDKGPIAMAVTDMDGKFQLTTGSVRGAVVGPVKVAISATTPGGVDGDSLGAISKNPQSQAEADAFMKKAAEIQADMAAGKITDVIPKSLIPERYGKSESSGLAYEIKANGDNHFAIELTN